MATGEELPVRQDRPSLSDPRVDSKPRPSLELPVRQDRPSLSAWTGSRLGEFGPESCRSDRTGLR